MLYDTAARANEVLALDVADVDLGERSAVIVAKGGDVDRLYWATGTARLLPHLLDGRAAGPLFLASRRPVRPMPVADVDPSSGRARLSYRRAEELWKDASGGHTLHQLRHSALTHLAEDGVDAALLKAKSRHRSLRSLERYVAPSTRAVKELTDRHDPDRRQLRDATRGCGGLRRRDEYPSSRGRVPDCTDACGLGVRDASRGSADRDSPSRSARGVQLQRSRTPDAGAGIEGHGQRESRRVEASVAARQVRGGR